jgi:uncharacterized membrane protein YjjB (DUF3815 family)
MEERSGINNLVGIDYSFLASFIVSPVSTYYGRLFRSPNLLLYKI